jgi:hypothetical protein
MDGRNLESTSVLLDHYTYILAGKMVFCSVFVLYE